MGEKKEGCKSGDDDDDTIKIKIETMKEEFDEEEMNSVKNVRKMFWNVPKMMADKSVPDGLVLKNSDLAEEVSGIFSVKQVRKGTVFGPYVGIPCFNREDTYKHGYNWDIFVNNKFHHCIDGHNSNTANWMRYVNLADSDTLQNLEAFQKNLKIFYRAIKNIPPHTELLVWHAKDYNQDLFQHKHKMYLEENKSLVGIISNMKGVNDVDNNNCGENNKNVNRNEQSIKKSVKHIEKNFLNKKFNCNVCKYGCDRAYQIKTHKLTHTGEKPFKCDVCESAFTRSGDLNRHNKIHIGKKLFKCDVCKSSFIRNANLIIHKRTHTCEKPYKCDVCVSSFTQSSNLKTHKLTHSGEKPYKCDVCDSAYTTSSHLKTHKLTHSGDKPYKCDVCESAFTRSSHLKSHKITHTGEKPYKCDVCFFTQSCNLKTHIHTHTREKRFKCEVCVSAFTTNSYLKRHKYKVHKL